MRHAPKRDALARVRCNWHLAFTNLFRPVRDNDGTMKSVSSPETNNEHDLATTTQHARRHKAHRRHQHAMDWRRGDERSCAS